MEEEGRLSQDLSINSIYLLKLPAVKIFRHFAFPGLPNLSKKRFYFSRFPDLIINID